MTEANDETKREETGAARPQIIPIFPLPIMTIPGAIPTELVAQLTEVALSTTRETNSKDARLSHTKPIAAEADALYAAVQENVRPHLDVFGELLLGEKLTWTIKEIWTNVLETGGAQALHNHANSFISGVIYLTDNPAGAGTVFQKGLGGREFSFVNDNERVRLGPFSASRWQIPPVAAGDMVLFPSFVLHEVPPNRGARRMTVALNALPNQLESYGYTVQFR